MPDLSEHHARILDFQDPLARFREEFHLPTGRIYMNANSLGLISKSAEKSVLHLLDQWKTHAISGWMNADPPWFTMAEQIAEMMAPLLGAAPEEIAIGNSTTVNLHQLLATLYQSDTDRPRIIAEEMAFPTDMYALKSHLLLRGQQPADLILIRSRDGHTIEEEDVIAAMGDQVQLVVLPSVLFKSGQALDMEELTRAAHSSGILIGFDCSHSIGVMPHSLDEIGVDFAFWCSYKYVNSGPGGAAGLYLNKRHFGKSPGLAGWFGSRKDKQFEMTPDMLPAENAGALQMGTPHVLSMAPSLGTLKTLAEAGIDNIRQKSLALTDYMMNLADARLAAHGFTIVTPREAHSRGGHLALLHDDAGSIYQSMMNLGLIVDHRPPGIIRLAPSPLYSSFHDVWAAINMIAKIVQDRGPVS